MKAFVFIIIVFYGIFSGKSTSYNTHEHGGPGRKKHRKKQGEPLLQKIESSSIIKISSRGLTIHQKILILLLLPSSTCLSIHHIGGGKSLLLLVVFSYNIFFYFFIIISLFNWFIIIIIIILLLYYIIYNNN